MIITNTLQLIRVKDWFKNLIIFFPIVFSGQILEYSNYLSLIFGFILFSFTSSIIYILNDIIDVKKDKEHPIKKNLKPLASGSISLKQSLLIIFLLISTTLILLYLNSIAILSILMYLLISLAYIFFIKNIPYLEFLFLPLVYVIRIDLGSKIIDVNSSFLMLLCTFLISTFFLLLKRIGELNLFQNKNEYNTRKVLKYYSLFWLKIFAICLSVLLLILIIQYSFFQNTYLLIILPMILFFLFRYYYVTNNNSKGEFPINVILNDKILISNLIITFIILLIIYVYLI